MPLMPTIILQMSFRCKSVLSLQIPFLLPLLLYMLNLCFLRPNQPIRHDKELELAEGRNTGIGKIVRAMRENGSPPPEFYNPETRSFMTVILPIHEAFKAGSEERISPHPAKAMEKTVVKTREKTREKILRYLAENPAATQNDIVAVIGISVKGVEWNLKTLKENGRLRRVGPDKGGHWEVIGQA